MPISAIQNPNLDPAPIFEILRGNYGSEMLTAAVAHFNLFGLLSQGPLSFKEIRSALQLEQRPAIVMVTVLKALDLVCEDESQRLMLTELAKEHLVPGGTFDIGDYIGLGADSPGVLEMVERLRTNKPADHDNDSGIAYIYRQGIKSAMEREDLARHFTLALAGRAKSVAPVLAKRIPLQKGTLLDVGGGTGIYSIACLQANPDLQVLVFDRPEVLKVAAEFARDYGVADRLECIPGDMFDDPLPSADAVLLSNVLHDWDAPECRRLVQRCAEVIPVGGRVLLHDAFLNDAMDGPLPVAMYSAAMFILTEGRAYSTAECRAWLQESGLRPEPLVPTMAHCGVLPGTKADDS